jgi:hypothetical protein
MKKYTVYFLTPQEMWEDVEAASKQDAINKCSWSDVDGNATPKSWYIAVEQKGRKTNERKT